jgi:hypothetical protein
VELKTARAASSSASGYAKASSVLMHRPPHAASSADVPFTVTPCRAERMRPAGARIMASSQKGQSVGVATMGSEARPRRAPESSDTVHTRAPAPPAVHADKPTVIATGSVMLALPVPHWIVEDDGDTNANTRGADGGVQSTEKSPEKGDSTPVPGQRSKTRPTATGYCASVTDRPVKDV